MAYTAHQRKMIALARSLSGGYSRRVQTALLEAMAVESNFRNLNYGDRDSQGVLQQRPSTGWGKPGNAAEDIRQFLTRAGELDRSFKGSSGQLAQAIQRSAFPARYGQRASEVASLLGGSSGPATAPQAASELPGASQAPSQGAQRSAFARALLSGAASDPLKLLGAIENVQERPTPAPAPPAQEHGHEAAPDVNDPQLSSRGSALSQLIPLGSKFGLTVTSTTSGKHTPTSWHYKKRAADYGGDQARMMSLMRYALANPHLFKEAFFDPAGAYVKNGKVYRGKIGGHSDHVHLAR